ncbi:sensor histidine kinase [Teredinibacter turnerae]|uniref:sensor histidine kinase n=1 Tax=Teredinibacter turnerae TaxID=2426 RepID=UPI00041571FC|nr:HAMP domain-containing sensor histidine kinase [Teredinibacter turnerae]
MNIGKSLRFRIIAGYVIFTLATTICYSLGALTVLKISDDELFNWYIAGVAEDEYYRYRDASDIRKEEILAQSRQIIVGTDDDVIHRIFQISADKPLPEKFESYISHTSRGSGGRQQIFELDDGSSKYHMVRIPFSSSLGETRAYFYYVVDVSAYNKFDVYAVQGTYFGLLLMLLIFLIVSSILGAIISRRVIKPLTQLTSDVMKADVGQNIGSYYRDEVGTLAETINDMMTRIMSFVEREKAFSRDVSHELRTPITSSQVSLDLALSMDESRDPKLRRVLERICDANRDMMHLIETFMLIGRESIPSDAVSATNLSSVVRDSITRNTYLISEKSLEVLNLVDESVTVKQPRKLLDVVVDNILRNAFQYTDQGNVTVRANEEFISVADTGRGFEQTALERLLVPYETFHGEGIGLGMNIIKRICKITGWRLDVRSECGVGTLLILHF